MHAELTTEHLVKAENSLEHLKISPKEKLFLDTLLKAIYSNKTTHELGIGFLNADIVHSIARLDLATAIRFVKNEPRPRVEVLAQLAQLAKEKPDLVIDVEPIIQTIESLAQRTEKNKSHITTSMYSPQYIGRAAVHLRSVDQAASERLLQQALNAANQYKTIDGWHRSNALIHKCQIIEAYAQVDPARAEQLLEEHRIKEDPVDTKPIRTTIQKYLALGDVEAAFHVAMSRGSIQDIALTASDIVEADPSRVIEGIRKRWIPEIENYAGPQPGAAALTCIELSKQLIQRKGSNDVIVLLIEEAKRFIGQMPPIGSKVKSPIFDQTLKTTFELIPVTAHLDLQNALEWLDKEITTHQTPEGSLSKDRVLNNIAIVLASTDVKKAVEIYKQTTNDSSLKSRCLIEIAIQYAKQFGVKEAEFLLTEFDEFKVMMKYNGITPQDLVRLSEFYPEKALQLLGKITEINGSTGDARETFKTLAADVFLIFDRNHLSLEEQKKWVELLAKKSSFGAEKAVLDATFLDRLNETNSRLITEDGVVEYFLSLDPNSDEDLDALKWINASGLIEPHNEPGFAEKNDPHSLTLRVLLICLEQEGNTFYDDSVFQKLIDIAKSETSYSLEIASQGIKLLKPHIAGLFYSSSENDKDILQQVYDLSPEMQKWFGEVDLYILGHFDTSNLIQLVTKLNSSEYSKFFPKAMEKTKQEILLHLDQHEDLADYFLENLHLYFWMPWARQGVESAVNHFTVAKKFILAYESHAPWSTESWAPEIYASVKEKLSVQGQDYNKTITSGPQGLLDKDPYEDHEWRLTGSQMHLITEIAKALKLKDAYQGEVPPELIESLRQVTEIVARKYKKFVAQVFVSSYIPEEDKKIFVRIPNQPAEIKVSNLQENVLFFVIRYLVQRTRGDITRLQTKLSDLIIDLDAMVEEGFNRYHSVYEIDIPLYDKLYEEFDTLRETGDYPLEVFLGRDGVYAWIGRRAQDVARRRKMGLAERQRRKGENQIMTIRPKYLIYPRYFRDQLDYDTKRNFLEQEGISPNADPLFYDTGYTGTIPEQIMRVMDFEDDEIEKRIRLLSAKENHRRVRGVPANARSEIIEHIEHNAKLEDAAIGLVRDAKTGRLRPVAQPTKPDQQFYFMMINQAIARHYWVKEHIHHKPSDHTNHDSENYTIRVQAQFSSLLPSEFISDPTAFFANHGEVLKSSKGEGDYPDEEIVSFKLSDGSEVVAKRVELRKSKEEKKEFAILIAAKRAGLPTAEPIGFLKGKDEKAGSYLLMKKVEGFSGRKFEEYLKESGKYSEAQINMIMRTVADMNKTLAEEFRSVLSIDKEWRIKDTIIQFDEEKGEVTGVVPIDWERVKMYDVTNPLYIEQLETPAMEVI